MHSALNPILYSPETVKQKKKPPACDSCKARRVLCHPSINGSPCPRCLEKGIKCTTTPVARRRPSKLNSGTVSAGPHSPASPSASEEPEVLRSDSPSTPIPLSPRDLARYPELSPELVHHLFECFTYLPQFNLHPLFRRIILRDALSSVSWHIHLLPPQQRVLAHCVVALAASISFDHAIIGPGSKPTSLADRSIFTRGADLRDYGLRRTPTYRALRAEALRLASEVGILLEPSDDNAVSCFMLHFLENEGETQYQTWAVVHLQHVRILCEAWSEMHLGPQNASTWTGLLLMEVMETTLRREPILVSEYDQLLITGREPLSLHNLLVSFQSALQARNEQALVPFTALRPWLFHVTRLARELYERITGEFARRNPLDEGAVMEFISSLNKLHSIRALIFDKEKEDITIYPRDAYNLSSESDSSRPTANYGRQGNGNIMLNLRSCAYIMSFSRATLVIALHRELSRRAAVSVSIQHPEPGITPPMPHWAAERLALLRREVGAMADMTAAEIARGLRSLPNLPQLAHGHRGAVLAWAHFCLNEADATGTLSPGRVATMERLSDALKLIGYAWPLPLGLVERLDGYVQAHRQALSANNFAEDEAMFLGMDMDMFPAPFDDDWMAIFVNPGGDDNANGNEASPAPQEW